MKATICPTVRSPSTARIPPTQMTITIPTLTHIVRPGDMLDMICSTRTERPVYASLAASKRSPSKSARTKDLTSLAPAMFSWRTVLSLSSRCWTDRKSGSIRATNRTMRTAVTTRTGSIARARFALVVIIRTRLPTIRSGARVPIRSEIRTTRWTAFASLVRRTSNRPVFCSSRLAKEKLWIRVKRASRRSRATLSATCTDRTLFPIANSALRSEMPSIRSAVRTTTPWS